MKGVYSRRKFIYTSLSATAFLGAGMLPSGCDSKKTSQTDQANIASVGNCDDLSGVSKADMEIRRELGYVNESPVPDNQCDNCNLYLPQKADKPCGGCMLFEGPVHAEGYCTYWAPQV